MRDTKVMSIMVVGLGSIGRRHLKNILALGYRNVNGAESDKKNAERARREFSIPVYNSLRSGLKQTKPDIVFICSPTDLHIPTATAALHASAHVFIEKPLSINLNGVDNLIRLAKKNKKTVMVACNYLFHGGFQKLRKILKNRIYGKPLLCRVVISYYLPTARKNVNYKNLYAAKKNQGGGVILDSGSHAVNYLENLFGKIKKISALSGELNSLGIQGEEAAILAMEHQSGLLSTVAMDYLSKKSIHRLEVVTVDGLLTLDIKNNLLSFEDEKHKKIIYKGSKDLNKMFIDEIKYFMQCVKKHEIPMQGVGDARRTLRVLLSVQD